MKRLVVGGVLAGVVALLAACTPVGPEPNDGENRFAAPDGTGVSCTEAKPCALDRAVNSARHGDTVALLDGDYGDVTLASTSFLSASDQIVVEPAPDAKPTIGKLDLNAAGTTWRGLTFTGGIYLDTGADRTKLDNIHLDGSGLFVHADDVTVVDSLIENGTSVDGVQIGGATGVLIENSTVRDFGQGADSDVHTDCVQLFDSSKIVLRGNYLGGCDNSALIFSPGAGNGIESVLVESNFVQGCVEKNDRCSQGTALDLRQADAKDVVVRNNTMLDGSVMVDQIAGLVFDRNIVGYASNCDMPMTNTIVVDWNKGKCKQLAQVGHDGNRVGSIEVVDRGTGDLRLVDPDEATIEATGSSEPAATGYGGADLSSDEAGAGG